LANNAEAAKLERYRHSTAHVLAHAVKQLFPETKLGIGPAIENGFYYDFDREARFSEADFPAIEERMRQIIAQDLPFEVKRMTKQEARKLLEDQGEYLKLELLEKIPDQEVTFYQDGDFIDLCRGPHVESTGKLGVFKLVSVAGAYWLGDERNKMLQRIYGAAFLRQEELDRYLSLLEEAKKRDHRVLGRQLELFSIDEKAGAGLVYWHPAGATLRMLIEDFWKAEHIKRGYQLVYTPHIAKSDLWHTSGHYSYYRENMYLIPVGNEEYVLKPMNCPGHIQIYRSKVRSYRDLPIRYAELGTVYRRERSGTLHGMLRVRGCTMDDAHIFCAPEQVESEIASVIDLAVSMLRSFGFENVEYRLSVRDPQSVGDYAGDEHDWELSEAILKRALEAKSLDYRVMVGEAAFYGPKIDFDLVDVYGHKWQGPTVQLDFNLPKRFELKYVASSGKEEYVAMIHRVVLGSMERFVAAFIEHCGGAFPLWLAPTQVVVLPISDHQKDVASSAHERLVSEGFRAVLDDRNQTLGFRIREHSKVPYLLIIGNREVERDCVSVRRRSQGQIGSMSLDDFIQLARQQVQNREIF